MFCPNCGSQVGSAAFCPNCGTKVSGAASSSTTGTYGAAPLSASGLTENVSSALCYLLGLVTGIIFLLIAPYNQNRTVRFHAFQSIFLALAWFVCSIAVGILGAVTHGFGYALSPAVGVLFFLLWLYMMYTAYNNKKIKLPVIGDLAEKQA